MVLSYYTLDSLSPMESSDSGGGTPVVAGGQPVGRI
jgi:hypothetical protein